MRRSIRREVLPDLPHDARIDDARVFRIRFLLRIQYELDGGTLRTERAGIKDVQTLVNGVALRHASFELERMNGRHLGVAAVRAHPGEARFEVLDRWNRHSLCLGSASCNRGP